MPAADHAGRRRVLAASFTVAALLHAALLFGFTLEQPRADLPATRAEQGIEVAISSFSISGPADPAQPIQLQRQEAAQTPAAEARLEPPLPSPVAAARPMPKKLPPRARPVAQPSAATEPVPPSARPDTAGDRIKPESEIHNPKPVYPLLARQRGQEGETLLLVSVDAAGRVLAVDVARSSGFSLLDDAAVKGVKQWRFSPAIRNGVAVAGEVLLPVLFRLQ